MTEVGVQLEGLETRRVTVDLAKSHTIFLLIPLARPPCLRTNARGAHIVEVSVAVKEARRGAVQGGRERKVVYLPWHELQTQTPLPKILRPLTWPLLSSFWIARGL